MGTTPKGIAGHTDYASWDRRTSDLNKQLMDEEEAEKQQASSELGLDGKHARSEAEAAEIVKAKESRQAKRMLDSYKRREDSVVQSFVGLLGPVSTNEGEVRADAEMGMHQPIRYVTRDMIEAGKRVVSISDTTGPGKIILTRDLSNLESLAPSNSSLEPKSYQGDAENQRETQYTSHRGITKLLLQNLHTCTVIIQCKIITGTVELSHCTNLTLLVTGDDATVPTIQADLSTNLDIQFHDAPSGKNIPLRVRDTNSGPTTTLFWGQDKDDRIYHAGVSQLRVRTFRDGYVDLDSRADYVEGGARAVGRSGAEEVQFVTSVVGEDLVTERVFRPGEQGNVEKGIMPLSEREMRDVGERRERIQDALQKQFEDVVRVENPRTGEVIESKTNHNDGPSSVEHEVKKEEIVEEIYASTTKEQIDSIVRSCEKEKAKGNEAFSAGEYAQAILFYTLSLDRAAELPDAPAVEARLSNHESTPPSQLFSRHIVLSNRSACFLKMGYHEKALKDATDSEALDATYVKGVFRKGLALHAMERYEEAIGALAVAQKLEPKNVQIKQALQFAEVRMHQELQKRMDSRRR